MPSKPHRKRLFYEIVLYSFAIEFVGAVILSFVFVPDFGALGIFEAIFLSVSAFCNAGFDLLTATPELWDSANIQITL